MNTMEKILPQNLEAETCVLGSMLLDEKAIDKATELLNADSFYLNSHRKIFEAITGLHKDNGKVDLVILTDKMRGKGQLEEIGGAAYLISLTNSVPTAANVEHYARIVQSKATLRDIISLSCKTTEEAYKGNGNCAEILADVNAQFSKLAREQTDNDFITGKELAEIGRDDFAKKLDGKISYSGLDSGYTELNNRIGGLGPGHLIIIGGITSVGKTAFMLDLFHRICIKEGSPSAFFSLEMATDEIVNRLVSKISRVGHQNIRHGTVRKDNDDVGKVMKAFARISESPLFLNSTPSLTLDKLSAKAKKVRAKHNVEIIFIDYVQLIANPLRRKVRHEEVGSVAMGLKSLARELNIPVIAGAQLNRAYTERGNKAPRNDDLRESAQIAHESDSVIFIHRPRLIDESSKSPENFTEIIVRKARHGRTGKFNLKFNQATVSFEGPADG